MRVHNRFGGTAGSAFFKGGIRDMRFLACGIRDNQGQPGSGSENTCTYRRVEAARRLDRDLRI